ATAALGAGDGTRHRTPRAARTHRRRRRRLRAAAYGCGGRCTGGAVTRAGRARRAYPNRTHHRRERRSNCRRKRRRNGSPPNRISAFLNESPCADELDAGAGTREVRGRDQSMPKRWLTASITWSVTGLLAASFNAVAAASCVPSAAVCASLSFCWASVTAVSG